MSRDMNRLEILTHRRVKFLGFSRRESYDWPVALVTIDGVEDSIWYDISEEGTYWCEEMDVSASIIELARRFS